RRGAGHAGTRPGAAAHSRRALLAQHALSGGRSHGAGRLHGRRARAHAPAHEHGSHEPRPAAFRAGAHPANDGPPQQSSNGRMVKMSPCLLRSRRRRRQRGMAVFLVVLVLTMVSAIGVFSMHSASLVDRATGFNRQNVQATAIVEFGLRGAATWLGPNKDMVESKVRVPGCATRLQAADNEAACSVLKDTLLTDTFADTAPTPLDDGLVGQLNSPFDASQIRAEVVTEMTEAFDATAAARAGSAGS